MSEKMTTITLPGLQGSGFSDYGEVPVAKMIAKVREHAQLQLELAQAILNAADGDFRVETYYGPHAQKSQRVIQAGRYKPPPRQP